MTKSKNKPIISMYKYQRTSFLFYLVFTISTIIFGLLKEPRSLIVQIVISSVLLILMLAATSKLVYVLVKYEIERDDELSRENMLKADALIPLLLFLTVAVMYGISLFVKIDFTIHITNKKLSVICLIVFNLYNALKSGLFLIFEGRDSVSDDEEE